MSSDTTTTATEISLSCTAHDYYCYNYHGPNSKFSGERSHFTAHVRPGTYKLIDNTKWLYVPNNGLMHYKL